MATQNPPHRHERSAKDTMVFDCINCVLGTGGRKAADRGEQGGDQELVCPDQKKKKASAASLQKIIHESIFPCISLSKGRNIFPGCEIRDKFPRFSKEKPEPFDQAGC
jgi:hypothetical protein